MSTTALPPTAAVPAGQSPALPEDAGDLTQQEFEAELDERLVEGGRVPLVSGRAEAVALAWAIERESQVAAAAHVLGLRAAILTTC